MKILGRAFLFLWELQYVCRQSWSNREKEIDETGGGENNEKFKVLENKRSKHSSNGGPHIGVEVVQVL